MTTYNSLVLGGAPGSWDTTVDVWDSATLIWDKSGVSAISEVRQVDLTRSISDNNATSRLEFDVPNWAGYKKDDFPAANDIVLYADLNVNPPVTKIFGGVITEVKFTGAGSNKEAIHITCRDYTSLLQKNTIDPEIYTNQEISAIVTNLMGKYAPLAFTTTNVQTTGVTLTRQTFKRINLFDALKQLADLAGNWFFYVDENKDLHFAPKNTVSSGITFDNTNTTKTEFKTDVESVKNRVYVYGARQIVTQPTETFTANGVGSVFTLQYSPSNTKVTVSGVQKKGGIYQGTQNATSGPEFLVDYNSKNIIFVSGTGYGYTSIPGSLFPVLVDYGVSRPIVKLAEDFTSIYSYGKRTMEIIDENIVDPQMAVNIAKTQLAMNKDPKKQGTVTVKGIVACTPGQTCIVDFPYEGQSQVTSNILEAKYTFNTINNYSDQVLTVKVASRIADVTDVLKNLLLDVKRLQAGQVDTTGILTRLISGVGSIGLRIPTWNAKTRYINDSFVIGHPINGIIGVVGSPIIGSIVGSNATWVSGNTGLLYDKALRMGSPTFVNVTAGISGNQYLDKFTLATWYNGSPTSLPRWAAGSNAVGLWVSGNAPLLGFLSGAANGFQLYGVSSNGTVVSSANLLNSFTGSWAHIAFTFDGAQQTLWLNGSNVGSGAATGSNSGYGDALRIGNGSGNSWLDGQYDDARFYRYGLASAEIGSLFSKKNFPTGSLQAYFTLDENVGSFAYSSASGGNYKLQPIIGDRRTSLTTIQSGTT